MQVSDVPQLAAHLLFIVNSAQNGDVLVVTAHLLFILSYILRRLERH